MDESCLAHRLTDEEREQFDEQGFLVVRGVVPRDTVADLAAAAEAIDAEWRPKRRMKPDEPLNLLDDAVVP